MSTTSQINPDEAREALEPYLKEGKDILHLSFSSGLSGTCNSMKIAAEELQEEYPERKIIVIDTLCACLDVYKRQTVHRVEVAAPVEDPDLKLRLNEMFITMLSDNVQARELNSSGKYTKLQPGEEAPLNSQEFFYESEYEALENQEKNKTILQ